MIVLWLNPEALWHFTCQIKYNLSNTYAIYGGQAHNDQKEFTFKSGNLREILMVFEKVVKE